MSKTAKEVIAERFSNLTYGYTSDARPNEDCAGNIIDALDAAGFVIVPKEGRAPMVTIILTQNEIRSGRTRQHWAEGLITQLPAHHEGRNDWLMNYGRGAEAQALRNARGLTFDDKTQAVDTQGGGLPVT